MSSVVGLISMFEGLKVPKWFLLFLPLGLVGLYSFIFLNESYFVNSIIAFIPSLILSTVAFIFLWSGMRGAFVKKVIFSAIAMVSIFLSMYGFLYSLLLLYTGMTAKPDRIKECVPVVEYGDYKRNIEFIGGYLILKYNGVKTEVRIPPSQAEKIKVDELDCLNMILRKGGLGGYYIEKIEW